MNARSLKVTAALILVQTLCGGSARARVFPHDSPKATLTQMIGLGKIEVSYSRPRVRGRKIWDGLVPFGKVWRTGANYPTFVTFEREVKVEGQKLAPGKYALYTIPGPREWTVIFSTNTELWGAFGYQPDDDALRVRVKPVSASFRESFTIEVSNVRLESAVLNLRWDKLNVPIRIVYNELLSRIQAELEKDEEKGWGFYWRSAKYLLDLDGDLELAEKWMSESLERERNWMNVWTRAELSAAKQRLDRAVKHGTEAIELCRSAQPDCAYTRVYEIRMDTWRATVPVEKGRIDRLGPAAADAYARTRRDHGRDQERLRPAGRRRTQDARSRGGTRRPFADGRSGHLSRRPHCSAGVRRQPQRLSGQHSE